MTLFEDLANGSRVMATGAWRRVAVSCAAFLVALTVPSSSDARINEEIIPRVTPAQLDGAGDVLIVHTLKIEMPALFVCHAQLKIESIQRGGRFKEGQSMWVTTRCVEGQVVTGDRPASAAHVYSGVPVVGHAGTLHYVTTENGQTKPFYRNRAQRD